ncbi:hypothetical protein CDAR_181171 [Caerostris darwini]|uniref:Uncharacterized protein n=1 Tax=Caerostris darwini TaxID=1538125 RepID=A0AAV4U3R8_9ARAC|nr:hypothetical protein CDAR_181171 [Caerostris darwini]
MRALDRWPLRASSSDNRPRGGKEEEFSDARTLRKDISDTGSYFWRRGREMKGEKKSSSLLRISYLCLFQLEFSDATTK